MVRNCVRIFFAFSFMAMIGCERADEEDINPGVELEPTLTSIQANIFNLNCALSGCHAGSNAAQGLNLSEGESFGNIVNVSSAEVPDFQRVEPGEPDQSYLYLKVIGDPAIIGGKMPLGRDQLTDEELAAIEQWIADGAMNN